MENETIEEPKEKVIEEPIKDEAILLKEFQDGLHALALKTGYGLDIEQRIVIKKINVENKSEDNTK